MGQAFRIVFDEDGYPRELIDADDRVRAVRDGILTRDMDVTVYRDDAPPGVFKAWEIIELRPLFGIAESPVEGPPSIDGDVSGAPDKSGMQRAENEIRAARERIIRVLRERSAGGRVVASSVTVQPRPWGVGVLDVIDAGAGQGRVLDSMPSSGQILPAINGNLDMSVISGEIRSGAMGHWIGEPFRKYAVFTGRARRREYGWFTIAMVAAVVLLAIATGAENSFVVLLVLGWCAVLTPWVAVTIRRLHDCGLSGWLAILTFVPWVGLCAVPIFALLPGTRGSNAYGPDPRR